MITDEAQINKTYCKLYAHVLFPNLFKLLNREKNCKIGLQNKRNAICIGTHHMLKTPQALLLLFWSKNWALERLSVVWIAIVLFSSTWERWAGHVSERWSMLEPHFLYWFSKHRWCLTYEMIRCLATRDGALFAKSLWESFREFVPLLVKMTFVLVHVLFREVLLPFWGMDEICGTYG